MAGGISNKKSPVHHGAFSGTTARGLVQQRLGVLGHLVGLGQQAGNQPENAHHQKGVAGLAVLGETKHPGGRQRGEATNRIDGQVGLVGHHAHGAPLGAGKEARHQDSAAQHVAKRSGRLLLGKAYQVRSRRNERHVGVISKGVGTPGNGLRHEG